MKKYHIIIVSILACILISACSDLEDTSKELSITITPVESTISINEEIQLFVNITDVSDLFGIAIEIKFDEDLIEVEDEYFTLGSIWDGTQPITYTNQETGRLNIAIVLEDNVNVQPISGSGKLFSLSFISVAEGESNLYIDKINLINQAGNPVEGFDEVVIKNATIIISNITPL